MLARFCIAPVTRGWDGKEERGRRRRGGMGEIGGASAIIHHRSAIHSPVTTLDCSETPLTTAWPLRVWLQPLMQQSSQ